MRTGVPSLITLTWLDRRRVWATANRTSALGATTIPVYPSLVGGQSSRPSLSHRYFTPSYAWLVNALGVIVAIILTLGVACYALVNGFNAATANLVVRLDRALHHSTQPAPSVVGAAALHHFNSQSDLSLGLPCTLFAVLGGLEVTSASIPSLPRLVQGSNTAP